MAACNGLRRQGVERIITQNEHDNPMLHINLALGFEPSHTDSQYEGSVAEIAAMLVGQRDGPAPGRDG